MAGITSSSSSSSSLRMSSLVVALVLGLLVCDSYGYTLTPRRPNPRNCGEAEMCCQGQNNTCFVFGKRVDRSEGSKRCYCDSNCLIMGDCCMDYHHVCKSVDCVVGPWEAWSECDNGCGFGSHRRKRVVQIFPDNGGHNCPVLKQRRACVKYESEICAQNLIETQTEEMNERARILPLEFGQYRTMKKYDPWKGILKNLYSKYFNEIFTRATYRGKYRIVSSHHGCEKSEWASVLKVDTTICVECQPVAMKREIGMRCLGHGVFNNATEWSAVDVPHCHGKWVMVEGHKAEVCDYDVETADKRNFIFI